MIIHFISQLFVRDRITSIADYNSRWVGVVIVVVVVVVGVGNANFKKYPLGTTIRPCLVVELTDE